MGVVLNGVALEGEMEVMIGPGGCVAYTVTGVHALQLLVSFTSTITFPLSAQA